MDLLSILLSGFVGALVATWFGSALQRRERVTRGLFAIQHELGRNSEMILFLCDPERLGIGKRDSEERPEIRTPVFDTYAWREHGAAVASKIAKRDWDLWSDLAGAYMLLDSVNRHHDDGVLEPESFQVGLADDLALLADEIARFFPMRMSMRYFRRFVAPTWEERKQLREARRESHLAGVDSSDERRREWLRRL